MRNSSCCSCALLTLQLPECAKHQHYKLLMHSHASVSYSCINVRILTYTYTLCILYVHCARCEQVPGASQFFLNYVITAALGALALELSGVVKIVILALKTMVSTTALYITALYYSIYILSTV
jgi:hypothetical protein